MTEIIQKNIKILALLDVLFLVFITYWFYKRRKETIQFISWIFKIYVSTIRHHLKNIHILLILIGMCGLTYLSMYFPLGIDESYTFLRFTKEGIYTSLFTYPVPNNHVFYSICTNFIYPFVKLIGAAQSTRLLSLFTTLLFLLFFAAIINKTAGLQRSVLFIVLYFSIPPFLDYSYQIRGYIFFIVLGILNAIVTFKYCRHRHFYYLFFLFNFFGFITSPSWLYSFLSFAGVAFISQGKEKNFLRKITFGSLSLFFSVLLFYSPIIIFYGLDSITKNPYVLPIENFGLIDAIEKLCTIVQFTTHQNTWISISIILLLSVSLIYSRKWQFSIIPIILVVVMLVLKQEPFDRIFVGLIAYCLMFILFHLPQLPALRFNNILVMLFFIPTQFYLVKFMMKDYFTLDTRLRDFQSTLHSKVQNNQITFFYMSKSDLLLNNYSSVYQWPSKKIEYKLYTSLDSAWKHFNQDKIQDNAIFIHSDKYSNWEQEPSEISKNLPLELHYPYGLLIREK